MTLYLNGRFLTRPATGVDRVAAEILAAIAGLDDARARHIVVLVPAKALICNDVFDRLSDTARRRVTVRRTGLGHGHIWEQWHLGQLPLDGPLLSLCSTGPLLQRNQALMIHDAQVWDVPDSFSLAFRYAYRMGLPALSRRVQTVLTVSEFAKGRLEHHGVVPVGKARVVLNGADHMDRIVADPGMLGRHGLARQGYFLAIGSLAPHKNLKLLIQAAAARPAGQPELVIAGGMNPQIFADAGLPVPPGVRFLGRVSDAGLKALYENALGLVFPSLTEGFGLPPVEAMRCGCPVIATTGGAVPEICGDVVSYVDPLDMQGWTAAMVRFAQDAAFRENLSARGVARARERIWAVAARQILDVLEATAI